MLAGKFCPDACSRVGTEPWERAADSGEGAKMPVGGRSAGAEGRIGAVEAISDRGEVPWLTSWKVLLGVPAIGVARGTVRGRATAVGAEGDCGNVGVDDADGVEGLETISLRVAVAPI